MHYISESYSIVKQPYSPYYFRNISDEVVHKVAKVWNEGLKSSPAYYEVSIARNHFELIPINDSYNSESIVYFTKSGLKMNQIFAINGLFYNKDLKPYQTKSVYQLEDTKYVPDEMIVMDEYGNTFTSPKDPGFLHHSSFFSGQPLAFAATCKIVAGKVQNLIRHSGHYTPGEKCETFFRLQLEIVNIVEKKRTAKERGNSS